MRKVGHFLKLQISLFDYLKTVHIIEAYSVEVWVMSNITYLHTYLQGGKIWPGLICVYVCTNQSRSYLNHLVLTYSTKHSPSWEANRFSASQ